MTRAARRTGPAPALVRTVNSLVRLAAVLAAAVLVAHILFVYFDANPGNQIARVVGNWADLLAWKFKGLFTPSDPHVRVAVNYGLAAVVYLFVARLVTLTLRRIAG